MRHTKENATNTPTLFYLRSRLDVKNRQGAPLVRKDKWAIEKAIKEIEELQAAIAKVKGQP